MLGLEKVVDLLAEKKLCKRFIVDLKSVIKARANERKKILKIKEEMTEFKNRQIKQTM